MIPALLNDPDGKKKVMTLVDNLNTTSQNLAAFSDTLKNGQGLVPRLMNDKQYGDQALAELTGLIAQLNDAVKKINAGEGTAGRIISDPSIYESFNDILIGINESKLLRWLIRNRQQKGIEKRYGTEQIAQPTTSTAPPPEVTVTPQASTPPPEVPPIVPVTTTAPPATTTTPPTSTAPPM